MTLLVGTRTRASQLPVHTLPTCKACSARMASRHVRVLVLQVLLVQIAVPSRTDVSEYQKLR